MTRYQAFAAGWEWGVKGNRSAWPIRAQAICIIAKTLSWKECERLTSAVQLGCLAAWVRNLLR